MRDKCFLVLNLYSAVVTGAGQKILIYTTRNSDLQTFTVLVPLLSYCLKPNNKLYKKLTTNRRNGVCADVTKLPSTLAPQRADSSIMSVPDEADLSARYTLWPCHTQMLLRCLLSRTYK